MGEINNSNDDEKEIIEGEESSEDNSDGADEGADGADKSDDDNSDDGEEADDDNKSKSKPTINADEEPKTRKRNIDFIRERQAKKAEKQASKGYDVDLADDDDDGIDPDDAKVIQRQVAKVLSPFLQKQMQDEDSQEIADFVKQNPDFAPYAQKVAKFAQHPTRRDMPIKALFYEVAGDDLLMIGAKRAQKAREMSKESGAGGGSGGGSSEKSVWDLTPEEFQAQQEAVRNKPRE